MIEKRLKTAADRIVMPEDMRSRITEKCAGSARGESDTEAENSRVYGVERVGGRSFSRTAAGIAACAVLAGGIGGTVYAMSRFGRNSAVFEEAPVSSVANDMTESPADESSDVLDIYGFFGSDFYRKTYGDVSAEEQQAIRDLLSGVTLGQADQPSTIMNGESVGFDYLTENAYYSVNICGGSITFTSSVRTDGTAYTDTVTYYDTDNDELAREIRDLLGLNVEDTGTVEYLFGDFTQIEYGGKTYYTAIPNAELTEITPVLVECGESWYNIYPQEALSYEQREKLNELFTSSTLEFIPEEKYTTNESELWDRVVKPCYYFQYLDDSDFRMITVYPNGMVCYVCNTVEQTSDIKYESVDNEDHISYYRLKDYEHFKEVADEVLPPPNTEIPKPQEVSILMMYATYYVYMEMIGAEITEPMLTDKYEPEVEYIKTPEDYQLTATGYDPPEMCYSVTFHTDEDALLGPIVIYVSEGGAVFGTAYRE